MKKRKLLEMVVLEAYRQGSISTGKVRELLDLSTRLEADAFLQANGVEFDYDEADLERDRQTHEQLRQDRKLNIS